MNNKKKSLVVTFILFTGTIALGLGFANYPYQTTVVAAIFIIVCAFVFIWCMIDDPTFYLD